MSEKSPKPAYAMGRAARVNLTFEILEDLSSGTATLDALLAGRFKHLEEQLERRDRRDLEQRLRAIMLRYRRYLWWLAKAHQAPTVRGLVLCDLVFRENTDLAQLQKLCSGGKNRMPALDKSEIQGLKILFNQDLDHPDMPEAVRLECPDWALEGFKQAFGDSLDDELSAMAEKPPLDLRTNSLRASRDEVRESLAGQGVKTENTPLSPFGLRQSDMGGPVLSETQAFRDGLVEVQDEGSQLVALMVGAGKSMQVADFCAGAGGKTLAMAQTMDNSGHLVAMDVHSKRLNRAKVRLKRAGVVNAERRLLEKTFDPWVKKNKAKFDRVLVDAPCTGTGTWRRNLDSKWTKDESDLKELIDLQKDILRSACRLVKPGGRLIYATCSLLPAENEAQVQDFLDHHPDFHILAAKSVWEETLSAPYPGQSPQYLRLSPFQNGTDGFFCAVMERKPL